VITLDGYNYQGCYKDFTGARVISSKNIFTNSLTVERCSTFCKGSTYLGLEYGKEVSGSTSALYRAWLIQFQCFCADTLASSTVKIADIGCATACSGNSTQLCGGNVALTVYKSTTLPDTSGVTPPNYKGLGCCTDVITDRTLKGAKYDDLAMTIPKCAIACKIGGWRLFGLEFGRECYCGNTLEDTDFVNNVQCGQQCPGDKSTVCGGIVRLSVYEINDVS